MKGIVILMLCALSAVSCPAMAMTAEIGKVTATEGRVDVTRAPDNEAVLLAQGAPVFVGDSIRTKDHSKAEIALADKSVVYIAPNTRIEIKDFVVKGGAREHAQIYVARGKILADVSRTGNADTFIITTPNAKGSVRGTEVIVLYQAERTSALVKDGRLSICNMSLPDQKKEITGGEAIMVPFNSSPEKPRPYMDTEFMLHEQDTKPVIFKAVSLGKGAAAMRGAITTLMGGVRVLKKGGADWHYAKLNELFEEGDKIETAEDGRMSIMFDNGNSIQIQPNSRIALSILKKDPKTGEFDNTFEVDTGKIKAIVEKLGKGSNFRVKTPTALCGVRGTVMYVNVAAGATQAFYEGGGGVVTNTVSGDTTFVESGQNTVSTDTGAISAPVATSAEAKMTLDTSFDYGVADTGYSSPENSTTTSTKDSGAAVPGVDNNADTKTDFGSADVLIPADLVPITEANKPQAEPGKSTIENVAFSGLVGLVTSNGTNVMFSTELPANTAIGRFTLSVSVNSIWTSVGQGSVIGNVLNNDYIPSIYAFWIGDQVKCTSANGGQYRGWLGASLSASSSSTATTLWGKALCLYRDPYGYAGTMTFLYGGKDDLSDKYFYSELAASGLVEFNQREYVGSSYNLNSQALETSDVYGRGNGSFTGGGTITCGATGLDTGLSGVSFNLPSPHDNWGIWQILAQGTYSGTTSDGWKLAVGGEQGSSCSWLGTIDGIMWDDRTAQGVRTNQATGGFRGIYFYNNGNSTFQGGSILNGDVVCYVDPTSETKTWQMIGGGEFFTAYNSFTTAGLGFTAAELSNFVNVPITQVAASTNMAIAAPSNGFTAFNMDARVYSNGDATRYWAGTISGAFLQSSQPVNNWTVTLTGTTPDAASVTLSSGTWDNVAGTWSATVNQGGTVGASTISGGQAGGAMTLNGDSSTIEGIAAGKATATPL